MTAGATLPDLARRMSRRIEQQKGMQLTPEDLDMLVTTGAYRVLFKAAEEFQRNQCLHRSAKNRSISGGNSPSIGEGAEPILKSSGTTKSADAREALAHVRQMLGKGG